MKTKITRFSIALFILALAAPCVTAQDFGFILNQQFIMADDDYYFYSPVGIPWFSAPLGEKAETFLSAGIGAEYDDNEWKALVEIYRFELSLRPTPNFGLVFGRQNFNDGLGLAMTGLFDGISIDANIGGGQLSAGILYTGLLYKKTALITFTPRSKDIDNYNETDGYYKYFASRRIVAGINWEKTSIFDSQANFWLSGINQVDLNDFNDARTHSQYLVAKLFTPLGGIFNLDFGGILELLEEKETKDDTDLRLAVAASLDLYMLFNGKLPGLLSLGGRFSTGRWNDKMAAYAPISGVSQGRVLRPNLSGIALVQADYAARLHKTLFMDFFAAYLFRTDTESFKPTDIDSNSDSPLLGGELFLELSWAPLSDLFFTAGGGVFFPQLGKAFSDNAQIKYRLELTAGISF